jgi:hypothetical protein
MIPGTSKRLITATILASTALTGAAWSQSAVSGNLSGASPFFTSPGSPTPSGSGFVYEVTVTDPGSFSVAFPAPLSFQDSFRFYRTDADLAQPVPSTASVTAAGGNTNFGRSAITFSGPGTTNGEQLAVTFRCVDVVCPAAAPFAFEFRGARLGWGAATAEEIATLAAGSNAVGRFVVINAGGLAASRGRDSLATRDGVLSFTRVADPETGVSTVTQSTQGGPGIMGEVYTWIDLTGFRAEDGGTNRSYTGRGLQIGADMAIGPDMVAGLSFGVQDLDATVGAVGQDGVLRYLQPYLAYSAGAWSGEASLIWGQGDFTQTSGGGTGTGETRLAALTFSGGYDMALGNGMTLTPTIGLAHGRERVEGVSGTLAGAGTETVRFTQASLGAEVRQAITGGEAFAGLHADWLNTDAETALVSSLLVDDGWTGRVALGVSTEIGGGMMLDTSVELGGLGGDLRSTSGSLRLAMRF